MTVVSPSIGTLDRIALTVGSALVRWAEHRAAPLDRAAHAALVEAERAREVRERADLMRTLHR
ncbi:hypothetical protein QT381_01500 [Galbitalea sp. SE-J8]|uniref:hypothetical protein n=1 Tax=Galbitalea sp. SE-J8 TaxID=3054952 RepID=UPI00259CD94D|nr:hypothetical protein [Galbitalea sp. SE-J8]MDM4761679.1 hypothetical protein [Galbitalea sp. SE-J8]